MIVRFGIYNVVLGATESTLFCPSCESVQSTDILVVSNYYHFFFVPIFPIEKSVNLECTNCDLKRFHVPISSKKMPELREIAKEFPNPWYTYTGIGIMISLILLMIIFRILV